MAGDRAQLRERTASKRLPPWSLSSNQKRAPGSAIASRVKGPQLSIGGRIRNVAEPATESGNDSGLIEGLKVRAAFFSISSPEESFITAGSTDRVNPSC